MTKRELILPGVLLLGMAALMLGPMREETATVDETTFIGGGYARLVAGTFKMAEENPILIQMMLATPMLAGTVHVSREARAVMDQRAFSPVGWPWSGPPQPLPRLFPAGVNWYHYGMAEAQHFGRILVYDPQNNAERILFWSRWVALLLTLATGLLIFFWTRQLTGNASSGVFATALWAFNPNALAYGHLAITEPGIALTYPLAVWWFLRTVKQPTTRNVLLLGVAGAVAMQMKFLALMLGPTFVVLLIIAAARRRPGRGTAAEKLPGGKDWLKWLGLAAAGFGATTLLIYLPDWSPPPPIDPVQAKALHVPGWFCGLRPLLIPGEFFKAVTLKLLHSQAGQDAFLMGEWRQRGWWYYYPVALWFKTPIPLLVLTAGGAVLLGRRLRAVDFWRLAPWLAAALYVVMALSSTIDIGVRHMLPVYPLLAVGIATELFHSPRWLQLAGWGLGGWLLVIALTAHPQFISYCNEFAGGTANGYRVLIDSNYDWGQDGQRLQRWMQDKEIKHVYLDFFGTQTAIEWYQIPNTRVTGETARQIAQGWLVVSVSQLMRPEWAWLRARRPAERIGETLFAYHLP